jgi:hypothetical protein
VCTHEAKLLAVMLRASRLTCVFGETGAYAWKLLKSGTMPPLQRRHSDRSAARYAAADDFATPHRRRQPAGRQNRPRSDTAIHFGTGGQAPFVANQASDHGGCTRISPLMRKTLLRSRGQIWRQLHAPRIAGVRHLANARIAGDLQSVRL